MPTLAETIAITTPASVLVRKARRLGVGSIDSMIALAVSRGCRHYSSGVEQSGSPIGRDLLSDEELAIILLAGENPYNPTAIRCAAQLARSPHVDPVNLARLARLEKTDRVLTHIARAGRRHDPAGKTLWQTVLDHLPEHPERSEPDLPHWTRFVSMPGRQRHGAKRPVTWLVPTP